jgi:hypothetical protein
MGQPNSTFWLDVAPDDPAVVFRQFEKPFANRPLHARLSVEPGGELLQKWHIQRNRSGRSCTSPASLRWPNNLGFRNLPSILLHFREAAP